MSLSADFVVIPHSATSRAAGDDISITISWNSGVNAIQYVMTAYTLLHVKSQ